MARVISANADFESQSSRVWQATAGPPPSGYRPEVPTYLFQSIAVTLLCCLPLGLVAIYYAAQVNSKLAAGNIPGAQQASGSARMWCWIAFASAFVWLFGWLLIIMVWGIVAVPMA
jgi:hypothetical protein